MERSVPWYYQYGVNHLIPQSIESDTWGGGRGVQAFDSCMWFKVPSLQDMRLLSWFLMSGKKGKKTEKATCTWVLGRKHPPKPYHFPLPSPRGIYSLPSYISPQELLDSTMYLDNYMENRALWKSGNTCSWLNQNNYHWGNNTVMFSFLNIWKECLVLQDGLKTVSRVSQATEEELIDCSLDHQTAQKVINFFDKDCIQIWD